MSNDTVISVLNVSKVYRVWESPAARLASPLQAGLAKIISRNTTLHRWLVKRSTKCFRDFYALNNVSFEISRGESWGIVGRNGSGKSTLLQIIAGTLQPTCGSVKVNGRVAALLELGSGFNPEFTGRENVFINGAVLGLNRREVEEKFEAIAAFADIGEFVDQPVKTYSSGMLVRLAFAVAINVSADIIIVDEALSVGDINFQAKCITALRQLQALGTTFLIVTHGTDTVKSMCKKAAYLKNGRLEAVGEAPEVADCYFCEMRDLLSAEIARSSIPNSLPTKEAADIAYAPENLAQPCFSLNAEFKKRVTPFRSGTGEAEITDIQLLSVNGTLLTAVEFNQTVHIRIHMLLKQNLEFSCGYHIRDEFNLSLLSTGSYTEKGAVMRGQSGDCIVADFITQLPLRHGRYTILGLISTKYIMNKTAQFVDWVENAVVLEMLPREPQVLWAPVYLKNEMRVWHLKT